MKVIGNKLNMELTIKYGHSSKDGKSWFLFQNRAPALSNLHYEHLPEVGHDQ